MSTREFFAKSLAGEIAGFAKVFRAMPEDQLHYKPHEKNTAAGALAWQMAVEMACLAEIIANGMIDHGGDGESPALEELATGFERSANLVVERARAVSDEQWEGPARFLYKGNVAWESTVEGMAWGFLFDLIHHRGQLTAYLRPMGGKVPGVYGPSADDV